MKKALIVVGGAAVVIVAVAAANANSPSTTPSGVVSVQSGSHPATADVTLTGCTTDPTTGWLDAKVTVVNHTSKPSNYSITVAFDAPGGGTQLGTGDAAVQNLAPGQRTVVDAPGTTTAHGKYVCKVAEVMRYAS